MTDGTRKHMKLGALFHPTGNHVAAWLHPDSQIDAGSNFKHYVRLAQTLEKAKFDFMFLADSAAIRDGNFNVLRRWPQYMAYFEPTTLLSGLAAVTEHLGLAATATTSYNEPFNIARRFASLDHISGGRACWNVVTSSNLSEAYNFGREEHFEHGERYDRALEFTEVVKGLWDSWEDDAFPRDRSSALYFHPEKLHFLNHKGKHFSVRGPLNISRSPQGHPVLAQAGSSETGKEFASRIAEVVFTPQQTLEQAKVFYKDLKGRMAKYGRSENDLKITPGLNAIVGRSEKEAEDKHQYLQRLIHPEVGLELLSNALGGFDLSKYPIDGLLPDEAATYQSNAGKSDIQRVVAMGRDNKMTIRELYMWYAGARGQRTLKGTASQIADNMTQWFKEYGVDGFLIQPSVLPVGLDEFVATVIPELQTRGVFRTEYEGPTLRDNLGISRPKSRYAK